MDDPQLTRFKQESRKSKLFKQNQNQSKVILKVHAMHFNLSILEFVKSVQNAG